MEPNIDNMLISEETTPETIPEVIHEEVISDFISIPEDVLEVISIPEVIPEVIPEEVVPEEVVPEVVPEEVVPEVVPEEVVPEIIPEIVIISDKRKDEEQNEETNVLNNNYVIGDENIITDNVLHSSKSSFSFDNMCISNISSSESNNLINNDTNNNYSYDNDEYIENYIKNVISYNSHENNILDENISNKTIYNNIVMEETDLNTIVLKNSNTLLESSSTDELNNNLEETKIDINRIYEQNNIINDVKEMENNYNISNINNDTDNDAEVDANIDVDSDGDGNADADADTVADLDTSANNKIISRIIDIPEIVEDIGKHQVTFSSSDVNEIKLYSDTNNSIHTNSLASGSDFSYTKALRSAKSNNIQPINVNKNIRLTKSKHKKKVIELDEIDYLYNKLQDYRRNLIINRSNYVLLIVKAIELIENYEHELNNHSKKDIVMKALNRLIMVDLDLDNFDQRLFLSSMSNIIELIIVCTRSKVSSNDRKSFSSKNENIDDIVLANCGQIIYSIIDKITTIVLKKQYNADKLFTNIATVTDILMILADKYSYLTGTEKKMIVVQAMDKFIKDKLEFIIELSLEKKEDLIFALDTVPMIIDLFIAVHKGKYKINKKQNIVSNKTGWFKSLCGTSKQHNE